MKGEARTWCSLLFGRGIEKKKKNKKEVIWSGKNARRPGALYQLCFGEGATPNGIMFSYQWHIS